MQRQSRNFVFDAFEVLEINIPYARVASVGKRSYAAKSTVRRDRRRKSTFLEGAITQVQIPDSRDDAKKVARNIRNTLPAYVIRIIRPKRWKLSPR